MRKAWVVTLVTSFLTASYLVWTFTARYLSRRALEREHEERVARSYEPFARATGTGLKILHFYASPAAVKAGERVTVCYGVQNANSVRIEPEIRPIEPSRNRCFALSATRDQTYTLTAEDESGRSVSASLSIRVQAARGGVARLE